MQDILNQDTVNNVKKENCFDFIRFLFAISLIISHYCVLTGHEQVWFLTGSTAVKAFFVITGFLVTYSFIRRDYDIKSYAIKRFARIVPAYVCCIIFCVMLGCFVSKLNVLDFFSSIKTIKYAICNLFMMNWLEPELPETFQGNIHPQMNGSIWVMKLEVIFYILVPFIVLIIRQSGKRIFSVIPVIVGILLYNYIPAQGQYFIYFFSAMCILLYFDSFNNYVSIITLVSLISELVLYTTDIPYLTSLCQAIEPLTFGFLIVVVAYNCPALNVFGKCDNITYGLFLYHFPIIQLFVLYGVAGYSFSIGLVLTIIITGILATLSWYVIEFPLINKFKYKGR